MAYINAIFYPDSGYSSPDITMNPSSQAPYEELELYNLAAGPKYRSGDEVKFS